MTGFEWLGSFSGGRTRWASFALAISFLTCLGAASPTAAFDYDIDRADLDEAIANGETDVPATSESGPTVEITEGPGGPTADTRPLFEFSTSDPATSFECSIAQESGPGVDEDVSVGQKQFASMSKTKQRQVLDRATSTPAERASRAQFGECSGPRSHQPEGPLADGAYTFRVKATNETGGTTTALHDFIVTTTPPDPSVADPPPLDESTPGIAPPSDEAAGATAVSASVATGAVAKPFGYVDDFESLANIDRLNQAAAGGATVVRIGIKGCVGFNDWGGFDQLFTRAGQLGMRVLLQLKWSALSSCEGILGPLDSQWTEWRTFAYNAIVHAGLYSGRAPFVEVWNEPNTVLWWGQSPNPVRYATTYWYAWLGNYDAEYYWGGDNPVMTGGGGKPNGSCPGDGQYICVHKFLTDTVSTLNGWGFFSSGGTIDMTGAHIYPSPGENLSLSAMSTAFSDQFWNVRQPYPWVPTFITEFGIRGDHDGTPGPPSEGTVDAATELAQCNQLLYAYNVWMPSSDTAGMLIFRLLDDDDNPQLDFRFMGTLRPDQSAKPAYNVLRDQHTGAANRTSC